MPRELKPYVVEQVSSDKADGFDVPLCFDRNKKVFFVEYELERVEHTDLKECRKLGRAMLDKAQPYKWEPFIEIDYVEDEECQTHFGGYVGETYREEVGFTFRRFERSSHPTKPGEFVSRWHPLDTPQRHEAQVREYNAGRHDKVIPYSEEVWAGLHAIHQALRDIRGKLHKLVMMRQLPKLLRSIGKGTTAPLLNP